MKKLFLLCSLIVGTSALISCSSDDDSSEEQVPVATSITLSSDVSSIDKGGSVTFTVMNDLEENVTATSTYFIDGTEISQVFTPTEAGTYIIHAKNKNLVSNTVTVEVKEVQPVATSITLSSDVSSIDMGGSVTFTVMNDLEENVTATSTYFIDDTEISQVFTPTEAGTYTIHAENDNLISNTLTIEVNAVQEDNSIFYKNENYKLENALLAYYGDVDAIDDGIEKNTHGYWVLATGNGDFNTTDSTDFIYFVLLTDLNSEGEAYLPSSGDNTYYYALALLTLDGMDIVENGTTEEDLNFAINADFSETADFSYSASIIDGSPIALDYKGTYLGYVNLAESDRSTGVTSLSAMNVKIDTAVLKALLRK